jgi:hypothetical protein
LSQCPEHPGTPVPWWPSTSAPSGLGDRCPMSDAPRPMPGSLTPRTSAPGPLAPEHLGTPGSLLPDNLGTRSLGSRAPRHLGAQAPVHLGTPEPRRPSTSAPWCLGARAPGLPGALVSGRLGSLVRWCPSAWAPWCLGVRAPGLPGDLVSEHLGSLVLCVRAPWLPGALASDVRLPKGCCPHLGAPACHGYRCPSSVGLNTSVPLCA